MVWCKILYKLCWGFSYLFSGDTIRYDTIEEINVDSKAEYTA